MTSVCTRLKWETFIDAAPVHHCDLEWCCLSLSSQSTNTPFSCSRVEQPKNSFCKSNFFPILIKHTQLFWSGADSFPVQLLALLHFCLEVELHVNKEKLDVGAKSQFTPPLHQSDMVICSFVLFLGGFCLCFIRQLISPVSLKQELIRFKAACMLCISLSLRCLSARISTTQAGLTTPPLPACPKTQKCKHKHASTYQHTCTQMLLFSKDPEKLQYHKAGSQIV